MINTNQKSESMVAHQHNYIDCEQEYHSLKNRLQNAFAEAQCDPVKSENWDSTYLQYTRDINMLMEKMIKIGYKHLVDSDKCSKSSKPEANCVPLKLNQVVPVA